MEPGAARMMFRKTRCGLCLLDCFSWESFDVYPDQSFPPPIWCLLHGPFTEETVHTPSIKNGRERQRAGSCGNLSQGAEKVQFSLRCPVPWGGGWAGLPHAFRTTLRMTRCGPSCLE